MNRYYLSTMIAALLLTSSTQTIAAEKEPALHLGMIHCCVESDSFMWGIANNIRKAAERDGNAILFTNANGSQDTELSAVRSLKDKKIDALLMSIVIDNTLKKPFQKELMEELKKLDIPVVFYLLAPQPRFMDTYKKAYRVGSMPAQSGILQGEMVSREWLAHPEWDKNKDGVMQYALLKGPNGNPDAEGRTKWVRATLNTFPVGRMKSQEVNFANANWDRKKAQQIVSDWIHDGSANNIEVLISNNDDMMLGARDALKQNNLHPALFGIDAIPETLKLIKQGEVAGTILQNSKAQADNAYKLAVNLATGQKNDNLDFPVAHQELVVPYIPVTKDNVNGIK